MDAMMMHELAVGRLLAMINRPSRVCIHMEDVDPDMVRLIGHQEVEAFAQDRNAGVNRQQGVAQKVATFDLHAGPARKLVKSIGGQSIVWPRALGEQRNSLRMKNAASV